MLRIMIMLLKMMRVLINGQVKVMEIMTIRIILEHDFGSLNDVNNGAHVDLLIKSLFSLVSNLEQKFDIKYVHFPVCRVFVGVRLGIIDSLSNFLTNDL